MILFIIYITIKKLPVMGAFNSKTNNFYNKNFKV